MTAEVTRIDLSVTRDLVTTALGRLGQLHNTELPVGGDRTKELAPLQRDLLYLSFLLEKAKIEVDSAYQVIRGNRDHLT